METALVLFVVVFVLVWRLSIVEKEASQLAESFRLEVERREVECSITDPARCPYCGYGIVSVSAGGYCYTCHQQVPGTTPDDFSDFSCPDCGGRITLGYLEPDGDYDDWREKPHCLQCGFEPRSDKHPFDECVPLEFVPGKIEVGGTVGVCYSDNSKYDVDLGPVCRSAEQLPGGMWFGVITLTPSQKKPGETARQGNDRAFDEARQQLELLLGESLDPSMTSWYINQEKVEALPVFTRLR